MQHPHPWTAHADDVRDLCEADLLDDLLCRYNSALLRPRADCCACLDQHHIAALGIRTHKLCSAPHDKEEDSRRCSMRQTQLQYLFNDSILRAQCSIVPDHTGSNTAVLIDLA